MINKCSECYYFKHWGGTQGGCHVEPEIVGREGTAIPCRFGKQKGGSK